MDIHFKSKPLPKPRCLRELTPAVLDNRYIDANDEITIEASRQQCLNIYKCTHGAKRPPYAGLDKTGVLHSKIFLWPKNNIVTGIHIVIHYNCTRLFLVAFVFADLPSLSPFIS